MIDVMIDILLTIFGIAGLIVAGKCFVMLRKMDKEIEKAGKRIDCGGGECGGEMKCVICDDSLSVTWTDTHGVGQCLRCGAPYRLYHYEGNKRLDKPPLFVLDDEAVPEIRQFYADTNAKLSAVGMGLSLQGGYDVAKRDDIEAWNTWKCPDA